MVLSRSGGAASFGLSMSGSGTDLFAVAERRWPWERPRPVQLTFGPIRFLSPVASRSGGPILAWGEIARSELRKLDPRTGRFEPFLDGVSAAYVDFSSDGRWVAWVSYPEGQLWRARADGSERLQLTAAPLEVHEPRFSPDGRRIVLVGRTPDEPIRSLYVVSADGTDGGRPTLLARSLHDGEECWDPCWAADGQAGPLQPLAFQRPGLAVPRSLPGRPRGQGARARARRRGIPVSALLEPGARPRARPRPGLLDPT